MRLSFLAISSPTIAQDSVNPSSKGELKQESDNGNRNYQIAVNALVDSKKTENISGF